MVTLDALDKNSQECEHWNIFNFPGDHAMDLRPELCVTWVVSCHVTHDTNIATCRPHIHIFDTCDTLIASIILI